jgi:hypothetical protein
MERPVARTFQDLIVWQKSHQLVLKIYRTSAEFPKTELYGLTQQLRRASVSIPANILSRDLGYLQAQRLFTDLEEVGRLLGAYSRALLLRSSEAPAS